MGRQCLCAALLLLLPATAAAQTSPEDLLPASNQFYFRWDGIEKHKASYAQTPIGKILKGDMGRFLASIQDELHRLVGTVQVSEKLLEGVAPDRLKKVLADADEMPRLLTLIGQKGLIVAAEVRRVKPFDAQATLVIPEGGSLVPVIAALVRLTGTEIKEEKVAGSVLLHVTLDEVQVYIWAAQGHAIVTIGSDTAKTAVERIRSKDARLTSHPLFARLTAIEQMETSSRGFVDLRRLLERVRADGKETAVLLSGLGVDGMKSLIFYSGFSGAARRNVVELESDEPGRGLHGLFSGKPFRLADVPPIPPDVTSWSCSSLDAAAAYDFLLRGLELAFRTYAPDQVAEVLKIPKQINEALGIDFRKDLLAALDDQVVIYNSPSEGAIFLGLTVLLKVKDPAKVRKALETALKSLGRLAGLDVRIQKRSFRGQELREVIIRKEGFLALPTFAIHNDWLVLSLFPQPVKGFILRTSGELPSWQPDLRVKKILDRIPERVVSLSMTDPRPGVTELLAYAPPLLGLYKSFSPGSKLELDTLPNAHEVTRHLFPNVSATTFQRNVYRTESISSLSIPFDLFSVDKVIALYLAASFLGFG